MIVIKRNHQDAARRKEQKKQNHQDAARRKEQKKQNHQDAARRKEQKKQKHEDAARRKEQNIIINLKFNAMSKSRYIDMNMENRN
ncbi:hypothetical protein HUZ99_02365 [Staphylococcus sp. SS87]|nr:hypothetical protein [Staphylococcus singaporensis]